MLQKSGYIKTPGMEIKPSQMMGETTYINWCKIFSINSTISWSNLRCFLLLIRSFGSPKVVFCRKLANHKWRETCSWSHLVNLDRPFINYSINSISNCGLLAPKKCGDQFHFKGGVVNTGIIYYQPKQGTNVQAKSLTTVVTFTALFDSPPKWVHNPNNPCMIYLPTNLP